MAVRQNDLLQGTLDLLILQVLSQGENHGYGIASRIHQMSEDVLRVEEGSLYPALYRMDRDGWIDADWGTSELGRKAKFYTITDTGRQHLRAETKEFASFVAAVGPLLLPT